ncbi:MAG: DHH family phosphoesterase [Clostridiales bacterium]|jgi:phosphoesterase RecJ-like protein|nr:DHH family phosphoesterase [Clostridiales bacterium]
MVADKNAECFEIIKKADTIALAGHIDPDGDAVSACCAAALFIKGLGKTPLLLFDAIPQRYEIIPGRELLFTGGLSGVSPDLFIAFDCGDKNRIGFGAELFDRAALTMNIDHHVSNPGFADFNHIESGASSTCEVLFGVIDLAGGLTKEIASAIYAGIVFDTSAFRNDATGVNTHVITSRLLEFGIPYTQIYDEIVKTHSREEMFGLKLAIENSVVLPAPGRGGEASLIYSVITTGDMERAGITRKDFEGAVNYLLSLRGAVLAIFIYQAGPDDFKISFRSKDANVSLAAKSLGGGGHERAAACRVSGDKDAARDMALRAAFEALGE